MPVDKYKAFYEIVKMLMKFDLTKLRAIEKELTVLSKVRNVDKLVGFPSKRIRRNVTKNKVRKSRTRPDDIGSKSRTKKRKASKKRPSPAQLRARKQFAMRVKRGDFR